MESLMKKSSNYLIDNGADNYDEILNKVSEAFLFSDNYVQILHHLAQRKIFTKKTLQLTHVVNEDLEDNDQK